MSSPIIVPMAYVPGPILLITGDSMVTKVKPELNSVRIHPQVSGISKAFNGWCVLVTVGSHTLSLVISFSSTFHPSLSLSFISLCSSFTAKKQNSNKGITNSNNFEEPIFSLFTGG
jgi:hypothetical protein